MYSNIKVWGLGFDGSSPYRLVSYFVLYTYKQLGDIFSYVFLSLSLILSSSFINYSW